MSSLRILTLSQCVEIVSGSTPKTSVDSFWDGDICWATPKDLSGLTTHYISNTPRKITKVGLESCGATILPAQSVLFSSRAPIGHVAINTVPMATNQGFKSFVPKPGVIDAKFLFHWLRRNRAHLESLGNGATFKEVSKATVSRIEISLPPFPEQRRIAVILDQAEALRAKRREALVQLDSLTQSIFIEMFGDPATNPKNWKIVPLGDVLDGLTDYHANGSYEVLRSHVELLDTPDYALMLRTTDLEKNNFSTGVKYITESAYYFLKKSQVFGGEIVINKIGSAGNVYLAPFLNRPISLGMNSFLLRITKCANSRFIFDVLTSDYIGGIIRSKVRGAVTKTITKEAVRSVEIPLPPLEMQNEYVKRIKVVEEQKVIHHTSLAELNILFASLQHRAFRGEL